MNWQRAIIVISSMITIATIIITCVSIIIIVIIIIISSSSSSSCEAIAEILNKQWSFCRSSPARHDPWDASCYYDCLFVCFN